MKKKMTPRNRAIKMIKATNKNDLIIKKKYNKTVADYMEVELAKRFGHIYKDEDRYDSVTKLNERPIEIKTIIICNTDQLTINNVDNKEDKLIYVDPGILDKKEQFFFIPKNESKLFGIKNTIDKSYSYSCNEEIPEGYLKQGMLVDKNAGGKIMFPKTYLTKSRPTWKKVYFKDRNFTEDQIKYLCEVEENEQIELMKLFNSLNEASRENNKLIYDETRKKIIETIKENKKYKKIKKFYKVYPL